jgi:hypothetical protein
MAARAMRLGGVMAMVAALALAGGLATAYATRTVRIASHISITGDRLSFSGRVTSPNSACDDARQVRLFQSNGNKLGSVKTGVSGHWKIKVSGFAGISLGHFYAKVLRSRQGAAGTIYVCKAARSKTIPFHS